MVAVETITEIRSSFNPDGINQGMQAAVEIISRGAKTIVTATGSIGTATDSLAKQWLAAAAQAQKLANTLDGQAAAAQRYAGAFATLTRAVSLQAVSVETAEKMLGLLQQRLGLTTTALGMNTAEMGKNAAIGLTLQQNYVRLVSIFDPIGAAAIKMATAMIDVNQAQTAGVTIMGGYAGALQRIQTAFEEASIAGIGLTNTAKDSIIAIAAASSALEEYQAELDGIKQRGTAAFDPLTASAVKMTSELRALNEAQAAGVNIAGGYAAAEAAIIAKYDEGAIAAKNAADALAKLADQRQAAAAAGRAGFAADQNQAAFNQSIGVTPAPVRGSQAGPSADVFTEGFKNQEAAIDAANAALDRYIAEMDAGMKELDEFNQTASTNRDKWTTEFDPLTASAMKMVMELQNLNAAHLAGANISGGYAVAYQAIIDKYDEGAIAAKNAAQAAAELAQQNKLASQAGVTSFSEDQNQQNFTKFMAQQGATGPQGQGTLGPINQTISASASGSVFEQGFKDQAAAIDAANAALDRYIAKTEATAAENAGLEASFNPIKTASMAYAAELDRLDEALARGIINDAQYSVELDKLNQRMLASSGTLKMIVDAEAEASAATKALADDNARLVATYDPLTTAAETYRKSLDDIATAQARGLISPDVAATAKQSAADTNIAAIKQNDPDAIAAQDLIDKNNVLAKTYPSLQAAQERYGDTLADIAHLRNENLISADEEIGYNKLATQELDKQTKSFGTLGDAEEKAAGHGRNTGLATSGITRELIVLGHEIATGNYSRLGGSLAVMVEYFTQVGGAVSGVLAFFKSPMGLAITATTALVAALAALAIKAEDANLRIAQLGLTGRGVRDDFAAVAKNADDATRILQKTTTLGTTDIRSVVSTLNAAPNFNATTDNFVALGKSIQDFSVILGETPEVAATKFTDAMKDPGKAATDLVGKLKGFDEPFALYVNGLQQSGHYSEAFAAWLDRVNAATVGATAPLTPLDAALQRLDKSFNSTAESGRSFSTRLGQPILDMIAGLIDALSWLIDKIDYLGAAFPKTMTVVSNSLKLLTPLLPGIGIFGWPLGAGVPSGGTSSQAAPTAAPVTTPGSSERSSGSMTSGAADFWKSVSTAVTFGSANVWEVFKTDWERDMAPVWTETTARMADGSAELWSSVTSIWEASTDSLWETTKSVWRDGVDATVAGQQILFNVVGDIWKTGVDALWSAFIPEWNGNNISLWNDTLDEMVTGAGNLWTALMTVFAQDTDDLWTATETAFKTGVDDVWAAIGPTWRDQTDALWRVTSDAWKTGTDAVWSATRSAWRSSTDAVWSWTSSTFKSSVDNLWESTNQIWTAAVKALWTDTQAPFLAGVADLFSSAKTSVMSLLNSAIIALPGGAGAGSGGPVVVNGATGQRGNIPTASAQLIDSQAAAMGISQAVADFATRIAQVESGGNQLGSNPEKDPNAISRSSAGALGLMQVEPDSYVGGGTGSTQYRTISGGPAAGVYDITTEVGNVKAGLAELARLFQKYNGDQFNVAGGYIGMGTSPQATAARVNYQRTLGLTPSSANMVNNDTLTVNAGVSQAASSPIVSNQVDDIQKKIDLQVASLKVLQTTQQGYLSLIESGVAPEKGAWDANATAIAKNIEDTNALRGSLTNALSTQQAAAKAAENANKGLADSEVGAQRTIAETVEKMRELAESAGTTDQSALFRVEAADLAKLTIEANDNVRAIDLQSQAQERLNPIIQQGGQAAEFAANAEKAIQDARKTSLPDTAERARQIAAETLALNVNTTTKKDNQASLDIAKLKATSDLIAVETANIVYSTQATRDDVVAIQERQKWGLTLNDTLTKTQEKEIALAQAVAQAKAAQAELAANTQELAGAFDQSFTTIGTSIVDTFDNGKTAAQNFQSTMATVTKAILNEFLKLAVINPILNQLFPNANGVPRPTFGGVGGVWDLITGRGNSTTSPSQTANDKLFSAGDPNADLSEIPVPPIPPDVVPEAHVGGLIGATVLPTRYVHPAYFDDAPRFHQGLAADEFPAVLQKGERVLTEKQDARVMDVIARLSKIASGGSSAAGPATNRGDFFNVVARGEQVGATRYHGGGLVGPSPLATQLPAALFARAPRYHTGDPTDPTTSDSGINFSTPSADASPTVDTTGWSTTSQSGGTSSSLSQLSGSALSAIGSLNKLGAFKGLFSPTPTGSAVTANDALFRAGDPSADLSLIPVPPVPPDPSGALGQALEAGSSDAAASGGLLSNLTDSVGGFFQGVGAGISADFNMLGDWLTGSAGPVEGYLQAAMARFGIIAPDVPLPPVIGQSFIGTDFAGNPATYTYIGPEAGQAMLNARIGPDATQALVDSLSPNSQLGQVSQSLQAGIVPPDIALPIPPVPPALGGGTDALGGFGSDLSSFGSGAEALTSGVGSADAALSAGVDATAATAADAALFSSTSFAADVAAQAVAQDAAPIFLDLLSTFHRGGIVGAVAPSRYVHPAYFDHAQRYHAGLNDNEFTTILQHGQRVLTDAHEAKMRATAGKLGISAPFDAILSRTPLVGESPLTPRLGTDPPGFPAVLQRGERVLGVDQQVDLVHLVAGASGSPMARQRVVAAPVLSSSIGDSLPRLHSGLGGAEFADSFGPSPSFTAPAPQGGLAATSTDGGVAPISVTINANGLKNKPDIDYFGRTAPQQLARVLTAANLQQVRNGN